MVVSQGIVDIELASWRITISSSHRVYIGIPVSSGNLSARGGPRLQDSKSKLCHNSFMIPVDVVPRVSAGRLVIGI